MRILHVASFVGNIGDNASHLGLSTILNEYFSYIEVEQLEIRKFYKNYNNSDKQRFDLSFINYANKFDLLIIGGGGFLDYWVEGSATGTTIDMNPDLVSRITVPTIISSVGCVPHKTIPSGNIEKFRHFLDCVLTNSKIRILFRNDGSVLSLKNEIGAHYLESISEVLDNGFFFNTEETNPLPIDPGYIAINITNDQLEMNSQSRGCINKQEYLRALAKVVTYITDSLNMKVVFIPHIYTDLMAISEVLTLIDDFIIRRSILVAPYIQYDVGAKALFSIYKHSRLVIGSRFHANVCALAMGVPTVGVAALNRVKYLYDQLDIMDNYVFPDTDFSDELIMKVTSSLKNHEAISHYLQHELNIRRASSKANYFDTFNRFGFKTNA
ncbi:polysaccharide pyruvyl transferase family protein [Methylophaga sp.]|uniref:polysaccharide pyruvyl transferase family protein n=1 Tax=Methylophaga sp. TaxID=2024840 RepID=UPI003A925E14